MIADAILLADHGITEAERKMATIARNKKSKNIDAEAKANLANAYQRHQSHLNAARRLRRRLLDQWEKHRRWEGHPQQLERNTA